MHNMGFLPHYYKDNEDNKWVKVTGFRNSKEAMNIYQNSIINNN